MGKEYVFVVNPKGANGRTGKEWSRLFPKLTSRLGKDCIVQESFTSAPTHAIEITREAIKNGADVVVAVGGDGTLHEVVNGFFENGKPVQAEGSTGIHKTALGVVPLGTGSDFARTFGWSNNPLEAFDRIAKGKRYKIGVGFAKTNKEDGGRYFVNVADLHLSAKAGYHAAKYKRFGNLCYVLGALQAFMGHRNQDLSIRLDEGDWIQAPQVTSIAVGNAKYFGGGMKITPGASPFSNNFEMVTVQNFKWFDFILNLNKLYNGTHLSVKNVLCQRAQKIEIKETTESKDLLPKGNVYVQTDGEHIGFLPATFTIIPEAIDMIV